MSLKKSANYLSIALILTLAFPTQTYPSQQHNTPKHHHGARILTPNQRTGQEVRTKSPKTSSESSKQSSSPSKKKRIVLLSTLALFVVFYLARKPRSPEDEHALSPSRTQVKLQCEAARSYATQKNAQAKGIGWINGKGNLEFATLQSEKNNPNTQLSPQPYDLPTLTYGVRAALKKNFIVKIDGTTYRSEGKFGQGANGVVYKIVNSSTGESKVIKVYMIAGERTNSIKTINIPVEAKEEQNTHLRLSQAAPKYNIKKQLYYVGGELAVLVQPFVEGDTVRQAIEKGNFNEDMGLAIYLMLMALAEQQLGVKDLNPANIILTKQDSKIVPIIIDAHPPIQCKNFWQAYQITVMSFLENLPSSNALCSMITQIKKAFGGSRSQPDNISTEQYKALQGIWNEISAGFNEKDTKKILNNVNDKVNQENEKAS